MKHRLLITPQEDGTLKVEILDLGLETYAQDMIDINVAVEELLGINKIRSEEYEYKIGESDHDDY